MDFKFTGWLVDYPDYRDYEPANEKVNSLFRKVGYFEDKPLPSVVDLRQWCSPIENQGSIGSCTAHAAASLVEYYERKAFGKHIDVSRLFLYKVSRNLLNWTGDTGAFLRTAMAALRLYGAPPETYWPYNPEKYDDEPPAFVYSLAQNYKATKYVKLDPPGISREKLLKCIKKNIAAGLPAMFGFVTYDSLVQARYTGLIPFPGKNEQSKGGHAIFACGFDDNRVIRNNFTKEETRGVFIIRNSWGSGWGDKGYGYLPYEYVMKGLAIDWWTLISADWVDTGAFGL